MRCSNMQHKHFMAFTRSTRSLCNHLWREAKVRSEPTTCAAITYVKTWMDVHEQAPLGFDLTNGPPTPLDKRSANDIFVCMRVFSSRRLLYNVFAYLIFGRIEHTLDTHQPEEQHEFRSKHRLGEHLLTASLVLDKATAHGIPVWW